jgi:hypothetical protein
MRLSCCRGLRKLTGSRRIAALCAGSAMLVALGVVPAAGQATAGQAMAAQSSALGHASGQFSVGQVSPSGTGDQSSATMVCALPKGWVNRTQACVLGAASVKIRNPQGEQIGYVAFAITQSMQLNPRSRGFSEVIKVVKVVVQGEAPIFGINLFVSCGSKCSVTNDWPQGIPVEVGAKGTINYADKVGKGAIDTFKTSYLLTLVAAGFSPVQFSFNLPIKIRCDDELSEGFTVAGCVFPSVIPTLTVSRADYGASAAMIGWAQQHLSAHWGLRGKGEPLTRLASTTQKNVNRRIVCNRAWQAYPPWVADNGKVNIKDSCDEFPFATTGQSGAMKNGKTDESFSGAECAQVKAVTTANSGSPARIWNGVEVIGSYSVHARCVRGHIPLSLNTDLGSAAWKAFIASDRLLNKDEFWVAVTA